jgi:hypothetical protein
MRRLSTKSVALIGGFASLHVILYFISFPLWRNWAIYLEPIEGIILGPQNGFLAALIGSVTARFIKPVDLWMFGIVAEPLGVLASGLLSKGQWRPVVAIYGFMLSAYFINPLGRWLPLWTVLDVLFAFALIYPATKMGKNLFEKDVKHLSMPLVLISFIGTATDSLTRIFLLIPVGLYRFFGWLPEAVYFIFITGAVDSYIEDILVVTVSFVVGIPLLLALRDLPSFAHGKSFN